MSQFYKLKLVFYMIKFPRWNFSRSNFPSRKNSSWKNPSWKNSSWKNPSWKNSRWKKASSNFSKVKNPRSNMLVGMGPRWNIPPLVHWGPYTPEGYVGGQPYFFLEKVFLRNTLMNSLPLTLLEIQFALYCGQEGKGISRHDTPSNRFPGPRSDRTFQTTFKFPNSCSFLPWPICHHLQRLRRGSHLPPLSDWSAQSQVGPHWSASVWTDV